MAAKLNIQLTQDQQKILFLVVVGLVGGGFSYIKYFWIPVSARINAASEQIEKLDRDIATAKGVTARRSEIQAQLADLQQRAADAETRLPKIPDVPAVIDTISRLARENRLDLASLTPAAAVDGKFFLEIPYVLAMTGTYHDIGRFFAGLALEERIYNVRNVNYSAGVGGKLTVSFTLVSYQYKG